MSKRKGVSATEKRQRLMKIFYDEVNNNNI